MPRNTQLPLRHNVASWHGICCKKILISLPSIWVVVGGSLWKLFLSINSKWPTFGIDTNGKLGGAGTYMGLFE